MQLEADVRKFRTQVREAEKLLALLQAAQEDPQQLIATPNSLLTSQPALRRLKDGLVDAQLATSQLGGTRSADHPRVRAAIEAEKQIRDDLHGELLTAIRGAEVELQLGRDRLTHGEDGLATLQARLNRLAEQRAEYSNRVAAVENSRLTLDRARQNLSTAKAAQAAAHSGSLVTRLDEPETGPYPAGPGRTVITLAGAVAGLMLGLGLRFSDFGDSRRRESPSRGRFAIIGPRQTASAVRGGRSPRTPTSFATTTAIAVGVVGRHADRRPRAPRARPIVSGAKRTCQPRQTRRPTRPRARPASRRKARDACPRLRARFPRRPAPCLRWRLPAATPA